MRVAKLNAMKKGWIVGNFTPTLYSTNDVEVAVKTYKAGDAEDWHYHKVATEITVIISGEVMIKGEKFISGDIIILEPGEGTNFRVILDTITTVVKIPGASNDKYLMGEWVC